MKNGLLISRPMATQWQKLAKTLKNGRLHCVKRQCIIHDVLGLDAEAVVKQPCHCEIETLVH